MALSVAIIGLGGAQSDIAARLPSIVLPPGGFSIKVYARVPEARSLAVGPLLDTVFVGTRRSAVYAVLDRDQDRTVEQVIPFATGLDTPNGVTISDDGWLYVAENSRILGYPLAEFDPFNPQVRQRSTGGCLPTLIHHGWRYLALGPDDRLYVALGAPCNICLSDDPMGAIARLDRDGSNFDVYARGIRNAVGMDWHPETGDLYFTNNGADRMGDDIPADTILRADVPGLFFGFPFVASSGDDTPSPDFADRDPPKPSSRQWPRSKRTQPRWACTSTVARCSPRRTGMWPSWRSTASGTEANRWGIGSACSPSTTTARCCRRVRSPLAGCRVAAPGAGRWI